jgi:hypothetical protein
MGVIGMKKYIVPIVLAGFFLGCSHQHQINIGTISLSENSVPVLKNQEYYMSFTQEYYDNKLYPLSQYCNDQRTYLADDKFSTETYLKISNERTKQSRVGKYPIWLLLNDDASHISCVKKSTNFINKEPFVVNAADSLSVKLLQKNEAETGVPVQELGILIDLVSLVVPRTANFLLKANNIINDPITQNYLNLMDESFKHGDLDGTKSRDFNSNVNSLKVKLYVPNKKGMKRELGYILLKPKYRSTLSTVNTISGIPNFRFIYNSTDPQIEDLMQYELKNRRVRVQVVVDNFKQVAAEHIIEALASLDTHLTNRFTRFDRALILNLALRQSDLYKNFSQSVRIKDITTMGKYLKFFNHKQNPLKHLSEELRATKCEYASLVIQAEVLLKNENNLRDEENAEAQRIKDEALRHQVRMQGIENFLSPVANWNYMNQMFTEDSTITTSLGQVLSIENLKQRYNRELNVSDYGCYVDLKGSMQGTTVQEYLIHPSYVNGEKYNYMALSLSKSNSIDAIFYKLSSTNNLKISKMFIDVSNRFISRHRIKEVIQIKQAQNCSENIRKLF